MTVTFTRWCLSAATDSLKGRGRTPGQRGVASSWVGKAGRAGCFNFDQQQGGKSRDRDSLVCRSEELQLQRERSILVFYVCPWQPRKKPHNRNEIKARGLAFLAGVGVDGSGQGMARRGWVVPRFLSLSICLAHSLRLSSVWESCPCEEGWLVVCGAGGTVPGTHRRRRLEETRMFHGLPLPPPNHTTTHTTTTTHSFHPRIHAPPCSLVPHAHRPPTPTGPRKEEPPTPPQQEVPASYHFPSPPLRQGHPTTPRHAHDAT